METMETLQEPQEELHQLIEVLSKEDEQIVRSFIKCLSGSGGQSHYERLQALLVASPYPTLQILQILHGQSKFHIGRIISAALRQMLDDDASASSPAPTRLLSVLSNFPQQILEAATMQQKLNERIEAVSWNYNEDLMLSLLSRRDCNLINTVFHTQKQEQQIQWRNLKEAQQLVLHLALHQRDHFVPRLCQQLKNFECIQDCTLRNNLLILRLANEFVMSTQTLDELAELGQALEAFNVAAVPAELQPVHQFFYCDFQRLCVLLKFLEKQQGGNACKTIKVDALLRAPGVLSLVHEYGIQCDSEQIVQLIEDTYKWQQQTPALKCVRTEEMEILSYYQALSHVLNVILEQHDSTIREQLLLLSTQLRQLRGLSTLCSVLMDIFQLVFLRWEQLQQSNQRVSDDDEEDDDDEQYVDDDATPPRTANAISKAQRRYGFICRAPVLYALFSYLKSFVTKKLHTQDFKCATEEQQRCFQRLVDAISEALWKFGVLQKIEQSLTKATPLRGCHLEPEQLLQLIQQHSHTREKASSDDESRERCYHASSLTRRKSRKQRRAASFSGPAATRAADGPTLEQCRARAHQFILNGESRQIEPQMAVSTTPPADRSIIPKMLSTPEQLAIMALALKNFNDVKYIIETFHLEDSQLNRELQFMEHQQLIKQKLSSIYANYEALDGDGNATTGSTTTTVEKIKSVAAKGFELSKIISVVDNFAQAQKLQHSAELRSLLQRHSTNAQYGFLQQFQERNLNALIICDLIVNLRFNREITCNLLLVIRRQQQQQQQPQQQLPSDGSSSASPREIGAMYLIQNLCECMRLLEAAGQKPALSELLHRHSYALKPSSLALQLQREVAFTTLYKKTSPDYAHSRELRTHASLFQQLKSRHNYYARFCGYVQQLARLLQLRDPNLEYHNTQLLRHDPYQVIGELIYECDITPLEIESNVTALHLNLVHVIALNICPQLTEGGAKQTPRSVQPQKQETIHNYIFQHNQLLAQLLQAVQLGDLAPIITEETTLNYAYLHQLMQLPEMSTLALMYDRNPVMAALHTYKLDSTTLERLELSKELQLNILLLGIGGQSEPTRQLKCRIDHLIIQLIEEDPRQIQLAAHLNDLGTRANLLQQHFTKIPSSQLAKDLIERTLQHREATRDIPSTLRGQLEHTLTDITIYAKVSALLQFESWPQAYDFGRQTPNVIFEQLLQGRHFELCYEWCRMVQLTDAAGQQRVCLLTLLDTLLELSDDDDLDVNLLHIAELFPSAVLVNFLDTHKDKMRSLALLQWLIDYLEHHARDPNPYRNYQLSLELMRQLPIGERHHFWALLRYPLLIVEQLVMNTRFELLTKLLEPVRAKLQQRMPLGPCAYCFEKRGHAYDVYSGTSNGKLRFQLGHSNTEAFILLNFNSYQQDHVISNDCFDLLLRIYASKALDYHIANVRRDASAEPGSLGTDVQNSLDSLCGAFKMPNEAPTREQWTPDEEASHCMCCRRSVFTMLMRRHHCRRCGRVVCYACSTQRMVIPELYGDVEVRVCNDCCIPAVAEQQLHINEAPTIPPRSHLSPSPCSAYKWRLSGIITHDKLLREEFCYEHAPSVALSLSILRHHLDQRQCVDLLLFHCRKLEKLIVPNPEVDYELVAKMMSCLALAAKVRGAPDEFETIREHSEIIMAVVQQGCESLIPAGPLNNHSLRQLADALVEAENWKLALEVHLKWGFATTGVMAAHGLACLRAGCYDAAREKFAHCMIRLSTEELNSSIYKDIFGKGSPVLASTNVTAVLKKRPQRGPALLQEILQLIAAMPRAPPQPETLQRASLIRNSNSSLASLFSRRREPYVVQTPLHEPAINVMNALANLKHIAKGQYGEQAVAIGAEDIRQARQSRDFEESLHYVLTYGSHTDILIFLMQRDEVRAALRYWLLQQLDTDLFIQHIFLVSLAAGRLPALIEELQQLDPDAQLNAWRVTLLQTCRFLEQHQQLNSLYQLQLLLKDPVRASMTCVKFYPLHCDNFQKLHANAQHLISAHMHLQGELDMTRWEYLQREQQTEGRRSSVVSNTNASTCITMQLDARALNGHINTIRRQKELAKFLAQCEREQPLVNGFPCTIQILKQIRLEAPRSTLPTLFDGVAEKIQLCILVLLCGKNIDEGFGLAYGIMQDYKLTFMKVFGATAKYLAKNQRLCEVDRLLDCIATNNGGSTASDSDELLSIAINSAVHSHEPEIKQALDKLVKRIGSIELRISSYIFIGQLKSAYLLANKHERLADIRKILRQAEITNQMHIKKLCEKKLNINSTAMSPTPL
ncbi:zinc finger FYVE domain-containing protein 26 homolog [Drosophila innubila]|uniref:zinc finger FYVE domain-containing protein 26 homolog n=1 Tax=Drosophila innubila TaxID=198719 RepID=UPI00148B803A|nr:zinc finger FYVE domain-containing protein 26 homolog [Drosophila innubila]